MSFLTRRLHRFARNERGTIIVDAVLVLPLFIWAYAALFAYWDAYRSINTVQKASYTISDLLSRTQEDLSDTYIAGLRATMNYLLDADQAGEIRVTSYTWSQNQNQYLVIFSKSPNNSMAELTTADLTGLASRLPIMADGDSAVLLETRVPYTPPMSFGLQPNTIEQFVVTRPRFLPKICHVDMVC